MNIKVEIGTPEQQNAIKRELSAIENVCDYFDPPLPLLEVIVPCDLDSTINRIEGRSYFRSERIYHTVAAKTIYKEDGAVIVLSPFLYTGASDIQIRAVFYFHELCHVYNSRRFPCLLESSKIVPHYFANLYTLYDEYWADRKAFIIVDSLFPEKTDAYQTHIRKGVKDSVQTLANDSKDYDLIKREISSFRRHGDVMRFLWAVDETLDGLLKAFVHGYAYIDHFPQWKEEEVILGTSKFVNDPAKRLIGFMQSKYDEDSVDLLGGIPIMEEVMRNFGIKFEVFPSGEVYCHVLDI